MEKYIILDNGWGVKMTKVGGSVRFQMNLKTSIMLIRNEESS